MRSRRRYNAVRAFVIVLLAGSLLAAVAGCNTSGCLDNTNSIPQAGFYANGKKVAVRDIAVGGIGAPGDTLISDGGSITALYLPLRSQYTSASFRFKYLQEDLASLGVADTITFDYESMPYFASEECGASLRYRIVRCRYTTNIIESVEITDSLITNIDVERIRINLRAEADEE